ncbi:uncharacterized protein LOC125774650 isoform X1 [Anopheles funestus]|uniref:uncharacterized protein LOC125774650 isoform X1 n=1 Tax=Anopheles funestus TaxID=62324 RepID=UPI0020C714A2|nr:uncharacterized protein LOC125774650 isoform X1 [Anopheles funestus]XP_049300739.1 uncharacterized protein LOC125774650 isoform X1 [Anopheles funestus]
MDTTSVAYYLWLVVCLGWLPAFNGTTTSSTLLAVLTDSLTICGERECHPETEVCREESYCECKPHFENVVSFECLPCPGEGQHCRGCCISDALTCYRGVCQRCSLDSNGNCISQESLFFLTAAQVALATAMVLGVISLSFLLYKTLRNRLRRNNPVLESEFRQSVASRVSLSSIQQRVIRRLRDRPPKYETRHNYEYQQRQTERQTSQQSTSADNIEQRNAAPIGGPPPAYDGDTLSLAENPPPYTQEQSDGPIGSGIAVIDIPSTNTTEHSRSTDETNDYSASSVQGITNHGFEPDKITPSQPPITQSPNSDETVGCPKDACYDIPLVSSNDKTVYM